MDPILKAGAIIIRQGTVEPEVLLFFRGRHHQDWTFPKGHCEPGEVFEQAALREVKEETGLDIELIRRLTDMKYSDSKGEDVLVAMYLGRATDPSQKEIPEKKGDRVEWVPLSKVEETLTHANLKEYFRVVKGTVLQG